ncbi:MAG: hypothetical protein V3T95_01130, partial [Acidobacteriota bacterium]
EPCPKQRHRCAVFNHYQDPQKTPISALGKDFVDIAWHPAVGFSPLSLQKMKLDPPARGFRAWNSRERMAKSKSLWGTHIA